MLRDIESYNRHIVEYERREIEYASLVKEAIELGLGDRLIWARQGILASNRKELEGCKERRDKAMAGIANMDNSPAAE